MWRDSTVINRSICGCVTYAFSRRKTVMYIRVTYDIQVNDPQISCLEKHYLCHGYVHDQLSSQTMFVGFCRYGKNNNPTIWTNLHFIGEKREWLTRSCIRKIRKKGRLSCKTTKISFFTNYTKYPTTILSKSNAVYKFSCPG